MRRIAAFVGLAAMLTGCAASPACPVQSVRREPPLQEHAPEITAAMFEAPQPAPDFVDARPRLSNVVVLTDDLAFAGRPRASIAPQRVSFFAEEPVGGAPSRSGYYGGQYRWRARSSFSHGGVAGHIGGGNGGASHGGGVPHGGGARGGSGRGGVGYGRH